MSNPGKFLLWPGKRPELKIAALFLFVKVGFYSEKKDPRPERQEKRRKILPAEGPTWGFFGSF